MASIQTLERRIAALEARLADVEGGYGETIYQLHRRAIRTELGVSKLLAHFDLPAPTDGEVDQALEDQE